MNYLLTLALILFLYMSTWFTLSVLKKRNDVADVAWGLGFALLARASPGWPKPARSSQYSSRNHECAG